MTSGIGGANPLSKNQVVGHERMSVVRNSYTWRAGIIKSNLPSTTRHVLLTLSCHFNDAGEACYPSTRLLAEETGLSERAVITHLANARALGWLRVSKHGFAGQEWARNQYTPSFPEGTEPRSAPSEKGTEPNDNKALNDVQSNYSLELLNTTTTPKEIHITGSGGGFDNLIIEPLVAQHLPQLLRALAIAGIKDPAIAQDLLDELAGTIDAGKRGERPKVGNPIAWLKSVAATKDFTRARCFEVQARRQSAKHQMAATNSVLELDILAVKKGEERYPGIGRCRQQSQSKSQSPNAD